jgi:hypothetical protein
MGGLDPATHANAACFRLAAYRVVEWRSRPGQGPVNPKSGDDAIVEILTIKNG